MTGRKSYSNNSNFRRGHTHYFVSKYEREDKAKHGSVFLNHCGPWDFTADSGSTVSLHRVFIWVLGAGCSSACHWLSDPRSPRHRWPEPGAMQRQGKRVALSGGGGGLRLTFSHEAPSRLSLPPANS